MQSTCYTGSPMAAAEATLKADLVARCRAHPDDDSAYFSSEQVARIGSFFVSLLFHNYRLYQHAFTEEQGLTECAAQLLVETPIIPSFEGAMPEEEWHAQQAAAAAASEAKRVAAEEEAATTAAEKRAEAEALTKAETDATRAAELARKPATLEEAVAQVRVYLMLQVMCV
ncbi:hypothetical protein FOA52_015691 [Chlamydomonas sp. UWO 241]|nr:hypothetical protein FOA52_015691 [Chlamydomonas sp. UWO 241]